jgi:hypothetical protein
MSPLQDFEGVHGTEAGVAEVKRVAQSYLETQGDWRLETARWSARLDRETEKVTVAAVWWHFTRLNGLN